VSNEIEILTKAKEYIEKLAQRQNPLTDESLPYDTVLNNVRLTRCFFYVSGVLQKVIDNGGEVTRVQKSKSGKAHLPPFRITEEQKVRVQISSEPVFITHFVRSISEQIQADTMRPLKPTAINAFLMQDGYLKSDTYMDKDGKEKAHKIPTPSGERIGISTKWIESQRGMYRGTLYGAEAQQLILDNLDEIAAISNGEIAPDLA
jgi:hypothetical protein